MHTCARIPFPSTQGPSCNPSQHACSCMTSTTGAARPCTPAFLCVPPALLTMPVLPVLRVFAAAWPQPWEVT
jgi:hypothetical protein